MKRKGSSSSEPIILNQKPWDVGKLELKNELSAHVGLPTAEVGKASISLDEKTTPIVMLGISYVPNVLDDDDDNDDGSRPCPETDQLWGKSAACASWSTPHWHLVLLLSCLSFTDF